MVAPYPERKPANGLAWLAVVLTAACGSSGMAARDGAEEARFGHDGAGTAASHTPASGKSALPSAMSSAAPGASASAAGAGAASADDDAPDAAMRKRAAEGPREGRTALAFFDALRAGDDLAAGALFGTVTSSIATQPLGELWQQLVDTGGPFVGIEELRQAREGGVETVFLTTRFLFGRVLMRFTFDAEGQVSDLGFSRPPPPPYRAPSYADAARFGESEVAVGALQLPGTLSLPGSASRAHPVPAVVLVHGSGPQDRDATIGPNRPFKDLAWGLASAGIAVLRYEKRTQVLKGRVAPKQLDALTLREETIDDALAAASLLRQHAGVDARRVYVVGHSLGGLAVPRIARADPSLAGFVVLAGPTRPLEDVLLEQVRYLAALDGVLDARETARLALIELQVKRVKELTPASAAKTSELMLGVSAGYWLDLASAPPTTLVASERRPILVLQGERDYQVGRADFEGWRGALAQNTRARFKLYPTLDHYFTPVKGPSTPADYLDQASLDGEVVSDIAAFIAAGAAPTP